MLLSHSLVPFKVKVLGIEVTVSAVQGHTQQGLVVELGCPGS